MGSTLVINDHDADVGSSGSSIAIWPKLGALLAGSPDKNSASVFEDSLEARHNNLGAHVDLPTERLAARASRNYVVHF